MAGYKLSFCLLVLTVLGISYAVQYPPNVIPTETVVSIVKNKGLTPKMQLDAVDFLKRAYTLNTAADRCSIFRQLYAQKYTQSKWHVVLYGAFSVQSDKSIILKVNNKQSYLLFSTKK